MIKMYIQIEYNKMKDKELMLMLVDCCYKEVLKMENNKQITMSEIVKFAQQYGFIFPGSEIYGGLANTWDYGPLGIRLKTILKMPGDIILFKIMTMPLK